MYVCSIFVRAEHEAWMTIRILISVYFRKFLSFVALQIKY